MPELPQLAPPPGLDVPGPVQVPRGNAAVAGFQQAVGSMQQEFDAVATGVRRQQVMTEVNGADSDAMDGITTIENKTYNDPVKMAGFYGKPFDQGLDAFTKDVNGQIADMNKGILAAHPSVAFELQKQLEIRRNEGMLRLKKGFAASYEANQRALATGPLMDRAVNAILGEKDPGLAANKTADQIQFLSKLPGLLPNERIEKIAEFQTKLQVGALLNLAGTQPTRAITELQSPDFAKNYPNITPEQRQALLSHADTALELPQRQAEAQFAAMRGNVMNQALQMHNNGTFTPDVAQKFLDAGLPESDVKMLAPGFRPGIDEPSTVQSLNNSIVNSPLSVTDKDISDAVGARTLSTATALHFKAELDRQTKIFKSDIGAASRHLRPTLIDTVFPPPPAWATKESKDKVAEQRATLKADWDAAVKDAKNVKDVYGLWGTFQKAYKPTAPPKPLPPLPVPLPGERPHDYVDRLIKTGFSRAELEQYPTNPAGMGKTSVVPTESAGGGG